MKYVTKENFQQYDTALKDYIDDTFTQDLSSYGVSWKPNVADPHLTRVGNMTYHKSLPIQNNMKGCIAQMKDGAKIIYYLNPTDWRFRESPTILYNKEVSTTIIDDVFGDLKYDQQYVKINNIVCQVISINTSTKTATIKPESTLEAGTYDIELGSCTNGYDGEVMVEVPEFWIKSWDTDTRREVRITPTYIDDSWEHQPHILVSPYHDTVLNAIPTNMGYLSTLEIDSAVSICNINDYCRGGNNDASYDQYITTDRFRTDLGKPRTLINRATMRTNCRNANSQILSYDQYKNIFYWLYVIEYANFNSQEAYNATLTDEGYRQGGMGAGITTMDKWYEYNGYYPLTPCGYGNTLGNGTGLVSLTIPEFTYGADSTVKASQTMQMARWRGFDNPFGDLWTNLDGIIIDADADNHPNNMNYVYTCQDASKYADTLNDSYVKVGEEIHQDGYTKSFDLGDAAHIIPHVMGSDTTKYICDYHLTGGKDKTLRTLIVGGGAYNSVGAGLGYFDSLGGVSTAWAHFGFRSVSGFMSFSSDK